MGRVVAKGMVSVFLAAVLLSCAGGKYGHLKPTSQVKEAFEAYQAFPGYNYYYWGTYSQPVVIAGIKQDYRLVSKMWLPVDPQSKDFRTLIDKVSLQGMGGTVEPWGFTIIDEKGQTIGIWYSAVRAAAVSVDEASHVVSISPTRMVTIGEQPK